MKLLTTGKTTITDSNGIFTFSLPNDVKELDFEISTIGNKVSVHHTLTNTRIARLYVTIKPFMLDEFTIVNLSAEDVVRRAVAAIPDNYADSSYFAPSFYRQYERVNGTFRNLVEAQPTVMFQLTKTKYGLESKEAFAVTQFRRSKFQPHGGNRFEDCKMNFLLLENPVYHLATSSIAPNKLQDYTFSFDMTNASIDDYMVKYVSSTTSSETHGIDNYNRQYFKGESWESGTLVIDKKSFAIKKIERTAKRYPGYSYYGRPNLIYPAKQYFMEFIDAKLDVEYSTINGKWYLRKIYHRYTNELFKAVYGTKDYTVTSIYEWVSDSVSRYVSAELVNKFYPKMPAKVYSYDTQMWGASEIPFYFYNKDSVYADLSIKGDLEHEFTEAAKKKEK